MTLKRIAFVVAAFGLVGGAMAEPPKAKKGETKTAKKEDPMMAAMAKYATPGPQHKQQQKMVGTWNVAGKFFMPGQAKPMETTGTSEFRAVGDLWLVEDTKSEFMGKPFVGHGLMGYDGQGRHGEVGHDHRERHQVHARHVQDRRRRQRDEDDGARLHQEVALPFR